MTPSPAFDDPGTQRIVNFLVDIGLEIRLGEIMERTFLPGIMVDHGAMRVDKAKLDYPGDLLHEAGHLAVMEPKRRRLAHIDVGKDAAEEMMVASSHAQMGAR
jgi:hypothetical protein